jgi:ABC-2 type transport system ATP-binding protein
MTNSVRTTQTPALETRALSKSYGAVHALSGLDLAVPSATVFGLLGPNGAGKTTAVKILTTLSRPDSGTATVAGANLLEAPEAVRRRIGYVSQSSGSDLQATGIENLVLQARVHGFGRTEAKETAARLLDRFELGESGGRVVKTWSGGMRRRLDIALALVHRPRLLFLDEPSTGLDPEVRAGLWDEIRRLRDEGVTVLLTTHYLEEADQLADRVAIIDHGKIIATGTPSELKDGMRGDGLHIDLADSDVAKRAARILDGAADIHETTLEGETVHARTEKGAEAVPRVLAALGQAGIEAVAVTVTRPSLDDVFLRHTGHRYDPTASEVPQ